MPRQIGGVAYSPQWNYVGTGDTISLQTYNSATGTFSIMVTKPMADLLYQPLLVSGTNIKTVNGNSLLGSGNLVIGGGGGSGTTTNVVTFNTTGGASPGATFDGSSPVTVSASTVGALALGGGTLTGTVNGTILNLSTNLVTPEIGISSAAYLNNNVFLYGKNFANTDYKGLIGLSTGDKIVIDNGALGILTGGNLTVGGTVSATNLSGTNTGDQTNISGNAGTATVLATGRTIGTLTGDVTAAGSSFNGSANNTNATVVAQINGITKNYYDPTSSIQTQLNSKLASSGFTTSAINTLYGYTPANGAFYLPLTGGNLSGNLGVMKSDPDEVQLLVRNSNGGNKNLTLSSMSAGYGITNWANNAVIEATNSLVLSAASATGKIYFQSNGRTNVGNIDESGSLNMNGAFNSSATQTTVSGSISGNIVASMPFQGSNYKKVLIYLNALNGAATYNFPIAFTQSPAYGILGTSISGAATPTLVTTTAITITGGPAATGWYFVEGY